MLSALLLHACTSSLLHLPLHYNVMPSHAPFSFSIFLLHPVHLSTSPVTLTSVPGVRCFHCVIAFNILCHSHNWSGRVWLGFKVHASIPIFRQFCIKCSSILCIIIVAQYCECVSVAQGVMCVCFSNHFGEWRGCRQSLLFNDLFVVNVVAWRQLAKRSPLWIISNVHLEKLT